MTELIRVTMVANNNTISLEADLAAVRERLRLLEQAGDALACLFDSDYEVVARWRALHSGDQEPA